MSSERIEVEPEVLIWARKALGLDEVGAGKKIGVSESILSGWESGTVAPTIKQLRNAARAYKVPLAVLLLSEPPRKFEPIRDFRQTIAAGNRKFSPELHAELRRAEMQREVFLEISELAPDVLDETTPLPSLTLQSSPEEAGALLREYVEVSSDAQTSWKDPQKALNGWVDALEKKGILVIHASSIKLEEARGFSISEMPFPVIGLNGKDKPRPRIFTLFHELAHIALNVGGLCILDEPKGIPSKKRESIEKFCNAVAVSAVVPASHLHSLPEVANASKNYRWTLIELNKLAKHYNISSEAILLRLVNQGKASWDLYWERKPELERLYKKSLEDRKKQLKASPGGPSYYAVKAQGIGHGYAHTVLSAFRSRAISSLDVSDYLQVKFDKIPKLEAALR